VSVSYYADEHFPGQITRGLRKRGVDVLTVQDDGRSGEKDDAALLDRATALGRVMLSCDRDHLIEAGRRQQTGQAFAGLVYAIAGATATGRCVTDLEIMAKVGDPADFANQVEYVPY
jgi:hypothetical protein